MAAAQNLLGGSRKPRPIQSSKTLLSGTSSRMLHTLTARRGMMVAPHHLAAQSGLAILREGGNAVEAMVAAAATIAVTYPHMNSVGGDGFWLIARPGMDPVGIEACGTAARRATLESYRARGLA